MAELAFDCVGAHADKYAVAPSMSLTLRIAETSGQKVEAIALRCQIRIEPTRRRYSDAEAERLNDLFGDTQRWADTLKPLQFTNVSVMVPGFTGSTEVDLPVMLSYDLEIGSTRYFAGLDDGEIPLLLLFSGTVFSNVDGRLQAQQVPWSKEAAYRLPVSLWREAIEMHFPDSAWIRMSLHTLDELQRFKNREALPTWDATITALLTRAGGGTGRDGGEPEPAARARRSGHEDGLRAPRARPQGGGRDPLRGIPAVPVPRVGAEEPGAVPVRGPHAAGLLRDRPERDFRLPDRVPGGMRRRCPGAGHGPLPAATAPDRAGGAAARRRAA